MPINKKTIKIPVCKFDAAISYEISVLRGVVHRLLGSLDQRANRYTTEPI